MLLPFLKKFGKLLAFVSLFYLLGIIVWGSFVHPAFRKNIVYFQGSYGHLYSRIADLQHTEQMEILFVGSSACYRGFDPRIFEQAGYTSFNLGSNSQSHLQTKVLLQQYVPQLKPKLVIYEVGANGFRSDGVESSLDLLSNGMIDEHMFRMVLDVNHLKSYNTFIFAFFNQLIGQHRKHVEPKQSGVDTYVGGGFVEREISHFVPTEQFPSREVVFGSQQLTAFEDNLAFLEEQGVSYLLVQAPRTKFSYRVTTNHAYADSTLSQYGTYLNFNEILSLNDSLHFYDAGHLNQLGVKEFNEDLIQRVKPLLAK